MKKDFFIGVILLLMGTQVFAIDRADLFEEQKSTKYLEFLKNEYSISKFDLTIDENDSCLSNCWADVYYEGEYVATFYDSAMGSNCLEAEMNCLAKLNSRLAVFMYAPR